MMNFATNLKELYSQDMKRADTLNDKLNRNGSLTDLEKIELRNLVIDRNLLPSNTVTEYLGIKKSNKLLIAIFILAIIVFVAAILLYASFQT